MNLYLAGPMRGKHLYGLHDFAAAAWALRKMGHKVFNPIERDLAMGDPLDPHLPLEDQNFDLVLAMTADLVYITSSDCDAVAVLPGWRQSRGALLEVEVAKVCGKEVFAYDPMAGLELIDPVSCVCVEPPEALDIKQEDARIHP